MRINRKVAVAGSINKKSNFFNKRKKKRRAQIGFLIFSLALILTAIAFTVSKIGQSQDNRQQAWDGSSPYAEPTGPSPEECTKAPAPEGCFDYLDNCNNCYNSHIGCEGCGEYNKLADKCNGLSGLLGSGDDDCNIVKALNGDLEPVVTEAPSKYSSDGPSPEDCTSIPVPEGCFDYLDNCKNCRESGTGCEGCGEYNDLADKCSGLSGLLGFGGDDCEIIKNINGDSEPIPTEAPQKTVPTEAPPAVTAEPILTETQDDSFRVKTKIFLLDLIDNL